MSATPQTVPSPSTTKGTLQAILYTPSSGNTSSSLQILDQLLLPHQSIYIPIHTADDAFTAIRNMSIRGAPGIAIVAALAVAVEISQGSGDAESDSEAKQQADLIVQKLQYLLTSRPTAVNLRDAVEKLTDVVLGAAKEGRGGEGVRVAYVRAAEKMLVDDVSDNRAIGEHGARWIEERVVGYSKGDGRGMVKVLTHCNTGSLATAGYGTALGIVRCLHSKSLLSMAYYTETRPYNQGSRLTGYELIHDSIPATMVTDSMAAALFASSKAKGEPIAAVIVGADRVAANGDTANKIGTYALAVLARYHSVKFLVAAPRTTIDLATPNGSEIVIEQRPPEEMLSVKGPRNLGYDAQASVQNVDVEDVRSVSIAALGTRCWNPAFDVTPAELIDGIVTEVGVIEKDSHGRFDLQSIFRPKDAEAKVEDGGQEMPDPREGP